MAFLDGSWTFSDRHLAKAIDAWRETDQPAVERIEAFYDWCLAVTETGPPDSATFPIIDDEDGYVSSISDASALITYLAVAQDRRIFVRKIEST